MRGRIRIAIACAGLLATSVAGARAQSTYRETGSVTVGGYIVWVRGTSANAVELFVGRGFRDAFARAHEMDAAKLQQWIDSVRAIVPIKTEDSSVVDARVRGSLIGSDVTMIRRVGGTFSGLRLLVSGEEPITMAEPTARDFIAALDSAAHAARDLTPLPATAQMLPGDVPVATTVAVAVVVRDTTPAPAPVVAAPPVVVAVATPAPAPAPVPTIGVAPPPADSAIATALGPSTLQAPPELVLPPPREPVILLASRVDIMPLPLPAPIVARPVVATPAAAPPPPPAPAPDTVVPPQPAPPADKLIHTPLGPFTIPGALLADRDKEAQYCYTQLGLKYNPDLKGEITVKVAVSSDGTVQDAVVTKRSWQGISAGEVESCVRALAHDWTFAASDPSVTAGAKLLDFSFSPPPAPPATP